MIGNLNSSMMSQLHQRRDDFRSLAKAVEQGDMTSAQSALTALQKDLASSDTTSGSGTNADSNPLAAKIKTDFSALTTAVQSGNAADAQSALKALKADRGPPPGPPPGGDPDGDQAGGPQAFMQDLAKLVSDVG
jgi:ribosomal protein S20